MPVTDDIRRLELAQLDMTAGLFTVLDNILSSIAPPPPVPQIKAGGHPEEIFMYMTEADKDEFECCICYMILKEAQQCKNKHKFCSSCILAWTLTSTSLGADKCPLCRTEGEYVPCDILNARLSYKRTKCQKENCDWTGFLKDFEAHEHNQYNAALKPGVKRSLPAVPGTVKAPGNGSSRPGMGTTRPSVVTRPTAARGATTNSETSSRSNPTRTITTNNQPRLTNRGQATNALRGSGTANNTTRPNQTASNPTTTARTDARPTPRPVRQANRQPGSNASGPGNRQGNNTLSTVTRRQTNALSNSGSTARANLKETDSRTPRPNSVARAPADNTTGSQPAGSQTTTTLSNNLTSPSTPTPQQVAASQTTTTENVTTPRLQATILLRRRTSTPNRVNPVSSESSTTGTTNTTAATTTNVVSESNNESEEVPSDYRPTRLPPISAARLVNDNAHVYRRTQFHEMATHIREGRSQLQDIMLILNNELETRRMSIARHQEFQERQHQERLRQLSEVHTLGQRLGEVASNLAVLMNGLRGGPARRSQPRDNDDD